MTVKTKCVFGEGGSKKKITVLTKFKNKQMRRLLIAVLLVLVSAKNHCTENCNLCVGPWICSNCVEGSGKDNAWQWCFKCRKGCKRCKDKDAERTCLECETGWFMREKGNKVFVCEQCPVGCATCSNYDSCDTCQPGYYLKDNQCRSLFL